jgi:hypothetical protein
MKAPTWILSLLSILIGLSAWAQDKNIDELQAQVHVNIFGDACLKTGTNFTGAKDIFERSGLKRSAERTWVSQGGIGAASIIKKGEKMACLVSAMASSHAAFVPKMSATLDRLFPGDWQLGSAKGKPVVRIKTDAGYLFVQILPVRKGRVTMIAEYKH